ncbi:DNA polymerase-3 subunit beta [Paenibacillus sp. UNC496MF]|nr:DNA polymerase-3 subunit beta [Paenibacillus sp. UNC496MF]
MTQELMSESEMIKAAETTVFTSTQKAKLTVKTDALKKALSEVAGSVDAKSAIPILTGVFMLATKSSIVLKGSNSNFYAEASITDTEQFMLEEGFTAGIVLPGKQFNEIVNKVSGKIITFIFDGLKVEIKSKGSKFQLTGQHHDQYPAFPAVSEQNTFEMPSAALLHMYQKTVYCASKAQDQPVLTGVNHEVRDQMFRTIATDRHRLSRLVYEMKVETGDFSHTVPASTLVEVMRRLKNTTMVKVSFDEAHVVYEMDNVTLYARVLEGKYPVTDKLVPPGFKSSAQIPSRDLKAIFKRTSLYNDASTNGCVVVLVFRPKENQLRVLTNSDLGKFQEDVSTLKGDGDPVVMTCNSKYMVQLLGTIPDHETVQFCMNDPQAPFVLHQNGVPDANVDLIVPVRQSVPDAEIKDFNPAPTEEDPFEERGSAYAAQSEEVA